MTAFLVSVAAGLVLGWSMQRLVEDWQASGRAAAAALDG